MNLPLPSPSSCRLVGLAVLVALAATGLVGASMAIAEPLSPGEIASRRDRVYGDDRLQTELPWRADPGVGARPGTPSESGRRIGEELSAPPSGETSGESRPLRVFGTRRLLEWLVLTVGGVLLVLALVFLITHLVRTRGRLERRAGDEDRGDGEAARVEGCEPAVDDLDALLDRGDYAGAIHLMLLRAVGALAGGGQSIAAGHTSREVLSAARLAPESRKALAQLVVAVERSLFGGREPAREDFERSRRAFTVVERDLAGASGEEAG